MVLGYFEVLIVGDWVGSQMSSVLQLFEVPAKQPRDTHLAVVNTEVDLQKEPEL